MQAWGGQLTNIVNTVLSGKVRYKPRASPHPSGLFPRVKRTDRDAWLHREGRHPRDSNYF